MKDINICKVFNGDFESEGVKYKLTGGWANTRVFAKKVNDKGEPEGEEIQFSGYSTVQVSDKDAEVSMRILTRAIESTKVDLREMEKELQSLKEQGVRIEI